MLGRQPAREGFSGESGLALSLGLALAIVTSFFMARPALAQGRNSISGGLSGSRTDADGLHYTNKRSFRIPFEIDKEGRSKIKEVQLWASEDSGEHWKAVSRTSPDRPSFTFRSSHDGEYWFAVRIFGLDGQFYPAMNETVTPGMKVLVDTKPPSLVLEQDDRKGTEVSVRWEVRDENLNLKSLVVEYRVEGVREWKKVPIRKPTLIGSQRWDIHTADAVDVRAMISDKAGNEKEATVHISEGTVGLPAKTAESGDDYATPPSISQVSNSSGITVGSGFGPVEDGEEKRPRGNAGRVKNAAAPSRGTRIAPSRGPADERDAFVDSGSVASQSVFDGFPAQSGMAMAPATGAASPNAGQFDAFGSPLGTGMAPSSENAGAAPIDTLTVASPRFSLKYEVDDAGPNGPATVELWVTRDNGRTWVARGSDLDRTSPFDVDLGGEGRFGIRLVSRSAFGQGDQPPRPGDLPEKWVIVDSTPPLIQLFPVQVGTGRNAGLVAIAWRAVDPHLMPNSTRILWRADQPGAAWQPIAEAQENTGKYIWKVEPGIPSKIHIRVEAVDTLGHLGGAETTDSRKPVIVDLSKPKSRIIGLDPNARAGMGATASQMR